MVIPTGEMLLRVGIGAVLGAAIGYEREHSGRPAGLRTHLLVAIASTTFMLVSTQFIFFQTYSKNDLVIVDTSRIAASVVTGVGFLGAGAILRTGIGVQGLTTAASLWLTASVGLAAGGGMYLISAVAASVSLLGLVYLRRIEGKQWRLLQRRMEIVLGDGSGNAKDLIELLARAGAKVADTDYDRNLQTGKIRLGLDIRFQNQDAMEQILAQLADFPGVRRIKMRRPG
jgi:putative Mg2+ transporter-C (MgtC) family protein